MYLVFISNWYIQLLVSHHAQQKNKVGYIHLNLCYLILYFPDFMNGYLPLRNLQNDIYEMEFFKAQKVAFLCIFQLSDLASSDFHHQ